MGATGIDPQVLVLAGWPATQYIAKRDRRLRDMSSYEPFALGSMGSVYQQPTNATPMRRLNARYSMSTRMCGQTARSLMRLVSL